MDGRVRISRYFLRIGFYITPFISNACRIISPVYVSLALDYVQIDETNYHKIRSNVSLAVLLRITGYAKHM